MTTDYDRAARLINMLAASSHKTVRPFNTEKKPISIRVDTDVLEFFRATPGYLPMINHLMRIVMDAAVMLDMTAVDVLAHLTDSDVPPICDRAWFDQATKVE